MHYTIKKSNILDDAIIVVLLLQVMIFRWLGIQNTVNDILTILLLIDLIRNFKKAYYSGSFICVIMLVIYVIINYFIYPGDIEQFFRNIYRFLRAILLWDYLSRLIVRNPHYVFYLFQKLFIPLNVYLLINIPILLLQLSGMTSLAARDMSRASSRVVVDYYSGLFGLYGTPCLASYCTLMFLFNIVYAKYYAQKNQIRWIKIYNYMQLVFFLIFSIINDNKFFYIEIIMYGIIIYISLRATESRKNHAFIKKQIKNRLLIRTALIITCIIGIGTFVYKNVTSFHNLVDLFIRKINEGFNYSNVQGGGERIGMILYMLNSPHKLLGYGFSRIKIEVGTLGFAHFGQGDIGTFMTFGGIIFTILLIIVIYVIFKRPYYNYQIPLLLTIAYLVMGVYTNAFHNTSTLVSICLLFITCWVANHPCNGDVQSIET